MLYSSIFHVNKTPRPSCPPPSPPHPTPLWLDSIFLEYFPHKEPDRPDNIMGCGGGDKEPSTYCKCNRTWLLYTVCKYSKYRYHMYNSKYIKIKCFVQCFVSTSALILVGWIRIQEGKSDPQKLKIVKKFNVLKCWMSSFEGWRLLL